MFGDSKAISTRKCFFVPIKWVWGLFVRQRQQYNRRRACHRRARCYIDSLCGFLMRENEWRAKKIACTTMKNTKKANTAEALCAVCLFNIQSGASSAHSTLIWCILRVYTANCAVRGQFVCTAEHHRQHRSQHMHFVCTSSMYVTL